VTALNSWFEQDKSKADFRMVYVAEAHPSDGWQVQQNVRQGVLVATHKAMEDRLKASEKLQQDLGLKLPIIVDGMDDKVSKAYDGWPDRIFIIDKDLKIVYRGDPGPRGFNPRQAKEALAALLNK
jgi:Iodothyronine deiodinase